MRQLKFFLLIFSLFLPCCSSIPDQFDLGDASLQAAIKVAQPELEKIFIAQAPILPSSRGRFSTVQQLPGNPFSPNFKVKKPLVFNSNGNLSLAPGDYIIPVMTYCMNANGASPSAHKYLLGQLLGARAHIIRQLNLKATPQFDFRDVQILSWSLQNGLSYDEMTLESRAIIDGAIPESKAELHQSFFEKFAKDWDQVAKNSGGFIPTFEAVSDEFLSQLGLVGKEIMSIRQFRRVIGENGNNYSSLSALIELSGRSSKSSLPEWSKVSDNVYARFLTEGHFQELGQIQIRVLPAALKRKVGSINEDRVAVDVLGWVGDPSSLAIQPLSFSPLFGIAGVLVVSEITRTPVLAAALLAAILADKAIDWDAFYNLSKIVENLSNSDVRPLILEGTRVLQKAHDELEKPARDLGIIDRKTKDTSTDKKNSTREYTKPGGQEALDKDFDKFVGEVISAEPGIEFKTLPNGNKVVKRSKTPNNEMPTLEFQPEKISGSNNSKFRIKVRYPSP